MYASQVFGMGNQGWEIEKGDDEGGFCCTSRFVLVGSALKVLLLGVESGSLTSVRMVWILNVYR